MCRGDAPVLDRRYKRVKGIAIDEEPQQAISLTTRGIYPLRHNMQALKARVWMKLYHRAIGLKSRLFCVILVRKTSRQVRLQFAQIQRGYHALYDSVVGFAGRGL